MPTALETYVKAAEETGLIDSRTASRLRRETRHGGGDPLEVITRQCRIPASSLYRALAKMLRIPYLDATLIDPPRNLLKRIPEALIRRKRTLPVLENDEGVLLATCDVNDHQTFDTFRRLLGKPVRIGLVEPSGLEEAVARTLGPEKGDRTQTFAVPVEQFDAVAFLDKLMKEAHLMRASDIHFEPQEKDMRIRLRIDGRLRNYRGFLSGEKGNSLISRVKVLAGMDIAERRAPQDGGFSHVLPGGERIDARIATAPTHFGERATMRFLGFETEGLALDTLGLSPESLEKFRSAIRRPHGIILLTGPTGSGKTTTLYAALREINSQKKNILTIEDPVEYALPGISQLQVDTVGKLTFAKAIRSLLRHDPDVLMVGEIRDFETADSALKAAMTGHLVFSTLHTNTACGAVMRLVDLGCEPYLVGATLNAVISQRLLRRLCPRCKRSRRISESEAESLGISDMGTEVHEPLGCPACMGTGYRGRIGIFEALWIDKELSRKISRGVTEEQALQDYANDKMTSLRDDGLAKVAQGITSIEEVAAVTGTEK